MCPVVVIGVGNEFRRDDGLGPEVIGRLREDQRALHGARLMVVDELTQLLDAWSGAELVILIDAVRRRLATPGRVHHCDRAAPQFSADIS